MKMSKRAVIILSFTLGALLFASTAFADMALGSGYDILKDSIKQTTGKMDKGLDNYTFESLLTFKDNGKELFQSSNSMKVDTQKDAVENTSNNQYANGKGNTYYSYSDPDCRISKSSEGEDKYYVTEFTNKKNKTYRDGFSNPFNEKGASELEKIIDAVVGNLKNSVNMEQKPDGSKVYSGSLSESQVPALINAVSSFYFKQRISENGMQQYGEGIELPKIESDIFVKNVTGLAAENKSGILENLLAEVSLSGKDKDGKIHEFTLNFVMKLTDVGSTTVVKPNITGKKVEKVSEYGGGFDSKYLGKYKNDIVIEKDGNFVKIGERNLEITQIDDKNVAGRYYESYKSGFESYEKGKYDFVFEMKQNQDNNNNNFTYTNAALEKETGSLHSGGTGRLYLNLNIEIIDENSTRTKPSSSKDKYFDGQFYKVFD